MEEVATENMATENMTMEKVAMFTEKVAMETLVVL